MKTFKAKCTVLADGLINPNIMEIYNVEDPTEWYPAGKNQFRINQILTENEFYLEPFAYGDERWWVAFRRR